MKRLSGMIRAFALAMALVCVLCVNSFAICETVSVRSGRRTVKLEADGNKAYNYVTVCNVGIRQRNGSYRYNNVKVSYCITNQYTSFQVFGRTYPPQKAHYSGESEAGMDFLPLWEAPLKASKIQPQFLFLKRLQIYVQMSEFLNFSLEAFPKNLETGVTSTERPFTA